MHCIKLTHGYSWGLSKDHKKCSRCVEDRDGGVKILFKEGRRQGQAFQSRGGGLTSYWSPRPQFIRPFQSYQQHTSSPLAPIQAFHTDFPNFIPAIGYPLSTYFTAPISQAQVVTLQVPVRRSSDQIKHQPTHNGQNLNLASMPSISPRTVMSKTGGPVQITSKQFQSELGKETTNGADFKLSERLHLKTLNGFEVRVRHGKRAPLLDICVPEMPNFATVQSTNEVKLHSKKNIEREIKQKLTLRGHEVRVLDDTSRRDPLLDICVPEMPTVAIVQPTKEIELNSKKNIALEREVKQELALSGYEVRVRHGISRRAPLLDICVPEMPNAATVQPTKDIFELKSKNNILEREIKQELSTPPRVSHMSNFHYAPEIIGKELAQPSVSVKQEFQRKIKDEPKVSEKQEFQRKIEEVEPSVSKKEDAKQEDEPDAKQEFQREINDELDAEQVFQRKAKENVLRVSEKQGAKQEFQRKIKEAANKDISFLDPELKQEIVPIPDEVEETTKFPSPNHTVQEMPAVSNEKAAVEDDGPAEPKLRDVVKSDTAGRRNNRDVTQHHVSSSSSVYSSEIFEACAMLSPLGVDEVNILIMTEPLGSESESSNGISTDKTEVFHKNVLLLAKLLQNSDDLITILHHFKVISSTHCMELKSISSEFCRFVGILAAAVTQNVEVFRTFLMVLRCTNNNAVADILDPPNGMIAHGSVK